MSEENPYESPQSTSSDAENATSGDVSAGKAAYNVVSDTVVGLNIRKSDNKFQALFVFYSIVSLAGFGAVLVWLNQAWEIPVLGGAMIGALAGLFGGFFASGFYLMIYRAVRHSKGQHD